jgi:hypothetical protein
VRFAMPDYNPKRRVTAAQIWDATMSSSAVASMMVQRSGLRLAMSRKA